MSESLDQLSLRKKFKRPSCFLTPVQKQRTEVLKSKHSILNGRFTQMKTQLTPSFSQPLSTQFKNLPHIGRKSELNSAPLKLELSDRKSNERSRLASIMSDPESSLESSNLECKSLRDKLDSAVKETARKQLSVPPTSTVNERRSQESKSSDKVCFSGVMDSPFEITRPQSPKTTTFHTGSL